MTGTLNRAALNRDLPQAVETASPETPLSLVMVDVDHFNKVNNTHGHPKGDEVLRGIGARLAAVAKGTVYRYGGEELAIILSNHAADEGATVAERARRAVEGAAVAGVTVTASFGVSCAPDHAKDLTGLVSTADKALYDAKRLGRNLVRVHGEPEPTSSPTPHHVRRKMPEPGAISDEQRERLRQDHFRGLPIRCPKDQAILKVEDITPLGSVGRDIFVTCPVCGLGESLQGPKR